MTIRAGDLDTRIALQRKSTSYSPSGEPIEAWATLVERWAGLKSLSGIEVNAADQWVGREQTQFTIRWSSEVDDLSPLDRIVCPSSGATTSPGEGRSVYDIISVHEVERNDEMRIVGARRVA